MATQDSGDLPLSERLDRIEEKQDKTLEAVAELRVKFSVLEAKAAIWGGAAGLVLGAIVSKLIGG